MRVRAPFGFYDRAGDLDAVFGPCDEGEEVIVGRRDLSDVVSVRKMKSRESGCLEEIFFCGEFIFIYFEESKFSCFLERRLKPTYILCVEPIIFLFKGMFLWVFNMECLI